MHPVHRAATWGIAAMPMACDLVTRQHSRSLSQRSPWQPCRLETIFAYVTCLGIFILLREKGKLMFGLSVFPVLDYNQDYLLNRR